MKQIYLDYSATTPVKEDVVKEMIPYYTEVYGNPSSLYSVGLEAVHETWITECPTLPFECTCKIRYRQPDVECIVTRDGDRLIVRFKKPVAAVAPGQSVVFYQGMDCLGGAVIDRHIKEN